MVGLPLAGVGTMFYVALLLGIGATKLWRWGKGSIRRIGKRVWNKGEEQTRMESPPDRLSTAAGA